MAEINTGGTGEGRGAGEPSLLGAGASGSGPGGGFSSGSSDELQGFIRTSGEAHAKLRNLQNLMSGEGKERVSGFTNALKKLNTEVDRLVKGLEKAKDGADGLPAGLTGGSGGGGSYTKTQMGGLPPVSEQRHSQARDLDAASRDVGARGATGIGGGVTAGGALTGAKIVGGGVIAAAVPMVGAFQRQIEPTNYLDTHMRSVHALGGGPDIPGQLPGVSGLFRGQRGGLRDIQEMASVDQALASQGVLMGAQGHGRMMRDTASMMNVMPSADVGQVAAGAASMQHGAVAQDLRLRGITTFEDDYPTQMRKVLRSAAGGREPTQELLNITQPGTILYDNLMALLGDDPALVSQVLEFGRADARGRAKGVDVTTRSGARAVFGEDSLEHTSRWAEGASTEAKTVDRFESLSANVLKVNERVEKNAEHFRDLNDSLKDVIDTVGRFGHNLRATSGSFGEVLAALTAFKVGGSAWRKLRGGMGSGGGSPEPRGMGSPRTPDAGTRGALARASGGLRSWGVRGIGVLAAGAEALQFSDEIREHGWLRGTWEHTKSGVRRTRDMLGNQGDMFERARGVEAVMDRDDVSREEAEAIWDRENPDWVSPFEDEVDPAGGHASFMDPPKIPIKGADHEGIGFSRGDFGGVKPHVAKAAHYITKKFGRMPGGIGGVGQRSGPSDHPKGLALDFMTMSNMRLGDQISNYFTRRAKHFGVKYVIWKQHINSLDGRGWRKMDDRGSPTANHMDHPHISFHATNAGGGSADPGEGGWGGSGEEDTASESGAPTTSSISGGAVGGAVGFSGSQEEIDVFNAFFGGSGSSTATTGIEQERDDFGLIDEFGGEDGPPGQYEGDFTGSPEEVARVASKYWSGNDLVTAVAVALAESRGNPRADAPGSEDSRGLWQINSVHHGRFDANRLYDPEYNAWAAHQLWKSKPNWQDWSVHPASKNFTPGNSYQQFMGAAQAAVGSLSGSNDPTGGQGDAPFAAMSAMTDVPNNQSGGGAPMATAGRSASATIQQPRQPGAQKVDVTLKIERASYDEAEKFAGWVMDIIDRKQDVNRIGVS